jgi:glycosyltransferase involved in cell wall biosynthesis
MSEARHIILPHGIPEPPNVARRTIRTQIRSELRIGDGETLLLYTGRIVVEKGLLELLAALEIAAARKPNIRCVMLGSHPVYDETTTVERIINKSNLLRQHVQILPACPPSKVWEYLCAADLFVFPSHNEGMPNSLLEAMIRGLPTIAFAIPTFADMNDREKTILLVPPLDVIKLSEAILCLVECPETRLQIGNAARRHVIDRYMVKANMPKALNYLRRVLLSRATAGSTVY